MDKGFLFLLLATLLLEDVLCLLDHGSRVSYRSVINRRRRREEAKCTLPSQPANGQYKVTGGSVVDGKAQFINLQYSCNRGFVLSGDGSAFCYDGDWTDLPRCLQTCRLMKHRSVQYNCIIPGTEATRPCRDSELDGTVVQPTCQRPHYYTPLELPYMTCAQGRWNAWPTCIPECGLLSSEVSSGTSTSTRVPWHAAIFSKNITAATHGHICSGSLISNSVVLSAAHCFWSDSSKALKEETNFAVAVGKLYSSWSHHDDEQHVQRSDVKKIVVPKGYRGADGDDLAVVVVSQAFEYQLHVRPICLDFKRDLFDRQLVVGNHGKSAGWNVPTNEVSSTKALQVIDMPFVSNGDCVTKSIAGDKLCAGNVNGPGLCDTDSGSGLVFSATLQNTTRYYLRGVVTTRLSTSEACNSFTTFTSIMKYQKLIKTYWFL